jgi:aminopeptidase N
MKDYLLDPALSYKYAKTPDLQQHLESASGQDLTTFFNQWYYNQGYPTYNLSWFPSGNTVNCGSVKPSQILLFLFLR